MPGQDEVRVQDVIQEHNELAQAAATIHGGASFMKLDLDKPSVQDRIRSTLVRDRPGPAVIGPPDWNRLLHQPPDPPPPAPELPEMIGPWNTGPIVFDEGGAIGGWAEVTLQRDGRFEFRGHLHDSGAASYNTSVVMVVRAGDGHVYTFAHAGATHGTSFAAGSRDDDWDNAGQNDELAANWGGLVANWGWNWSAVVNTDWQALLDSAFAGGGGRPEGDRCGRRSGRPRLDRMECLKRPGFCRGSVRTHRRRRLLGTIVGGFGPLLLKGPTMSG
jgi:hypothetical protein